MAADANIHIFMAQLVLMDKITEDEADKLQKKIKNCIIPNDWRQVILQIEEAIGREIYN